MSRCLHGHIQEDNRCGLPGKGAVRPEREAEDNFHGALKSVRRDLQNARGGKAWVERGGIAHWLRNGASWRTSGLLPSI